MKEYIILEQVTNTIHKVEAFSLRHAFKKASKKHGIYPSEKIFIQLL